MPPLPAVLTAIGVAAVMVVGGSVAVASRSKSPVATARHYVVSHVIDGDTLDVQLDGNLQRIRLLNIDTPETKDPKRPVQCLGPEATQFLENLLPTGTAVRLEFDQERTDRYGRTLAAVFTEDNTLVNAAIARAGMGKSVYFAPNQRFLSAVQAAEREATTNKRGLSSPTVRCTVPARVQRVSDEVAAVPSAVSSQSPSAVLETVKAESNHVVVAAVALERLFGEPDGSFVWRHLDGMTRQHLGDQAKNLVKIAKAKDGGIAKALASAKSREAADQRAQAKREKAAAQARAEAAVKARANQAAKAHAAAAKARAAAQTAKADAASRKRSNAAERQVTPAPSPRPYSTPKAATRKSPHRGGYDGYTGCRAYGQFGTSIDEKGRRYNKIAC